MRNRGILLMIISSLLFALMAAFVQISGDLPTMQKVFFRNIVGLAFSSVFIINSKKATFLGKKRKLLFYRAFLGLLGLVFYFYALDNLPLANAVMLNQVNPFFVIVLSLLFLKEKVKKLQLVALATAMLGIAFIVRPGAGYEFLPALIGLLSAFFAAGAYVTVRHLRNSDHPYTIVFYFTALTSIVSFLFMINGHYASMNVGQIFSLLAVGVFATGGQFFMTYSYRHAEAGDLSIYSYGNTVFSIVIGVVLWAELPDTFSLLGIVLILMGAYTNYRAKIQPSLLSDS